MNQRGDACKGGGCFAPGKSEILCHPAIRFSNDFWFSISSKAIQMANNQQKPILAN